VDPSGNSCDYFAMAIGARSQSAKTFLEANFQQFASLSRENLVIQALKALKDTLQQDAKLDERNTAIAIVGQKEKFAILPESEVREFLDLMKSQMEQ
jgi:20S proteasome subunit alpha 6